MVLVTRCVATSSTDEVIPSRTMVEHPRNGRRDPSTPSDVSVAATKVADLVLSGGGVKGIGLVGAVVALMDAEYRVGRISGTSAGSLVGAVIAAAARGEQLTGEQLKGIALSPALPQLPRPGVLQGGACIRDGVGGAARSGYVSRRLHP